MSKRVNSKSMFGYRVAATVVLLLLMGVPLAAPFVELIRNASAWQVWNEEDRLLPLAGSTLRLAAGVLTLALPVGILGAILLYRTDLPLRRAGRGLVVIGLFIPLPVMASAWQAALGSGGWLLHIARGAASTEEPWRAWTQGIGPAIVIHALAAIPWVILIVGQGLLWVEPELEEDALTVVGPWRVLWFVTLPRARAAIGAAALWVVLQTTVEVATVADLTVVRTFAEEVYVQFASRDKASLARSVAVSLPSAMICWILVLAAARWLHRNLPPLNASARQPLVFSLGPLRKPMFVAATLVVLLLTAVPMASLVWKMGLSGSPESFSSRSAGEFLVRSFRHNSGLIASSLLWAGLSGGIAAGLALVVCWLSLESRTFGAMVLGLAALAWALPGPVIGFGLKQTIEWLMYCEDAVADVFGWTEFSPLGDILYRKPLPVSLLWASLLRFFPCALALLWPVVRLFPVEWRDSAQVEGASPWLEFRHVVFPILVLPCAWAGLVVAVLSLGEISAAKLVETPGSRTVVQELFDRMHYGVTNEVAALCLVQVLLVAVGAAASMFLDRWYRRLSESGA